MGSELSVGEVPVGDWCRNRALFGKWRREKYCNLCSPSVSVIRDNTYPLHLDVSRLYCKSIPVKKDRMT